MYVSGRVWLVEAHWQAHDILDLWVRHLVYWDL